jgi:anti-sigma B factor antagonist
MLHVTRENAVTIVALGPEYDSLDEATIGDLERTLLAAMAAADPPRMVLDLANTRFLGSRFIEVVVRAWKRLRDRRGELALCNLNPFCYDVLERTQLNRLWRVYPSRGEAVAALCDGAAPGAGS